MKDAYHEAVVEAVRLAGYRRARVSQNSHIVYHKDGEADIIVPSKINDKNLARRLLKKAGLSL